MKNRTSKKLSIIPGVDAPTEKMTEWQPVFRINSRMGLLKGDMDFLVSFVHRTVKSSGAIKKVLYFRLAQGLIKKLGWENGEHVLLCFDKDDQKSMMLLKHDKGYKLNPEAASEKAHVRISRLAMAAEWCVLEPFHSEQIKYTIDDHNRLLFRVQS